jgi:imidazolonepropionase
MFFCETGYFTVEESEQIMNAGALLWLKAKIHVNQFNSIGDSSRVKHKALSVDHLEIMTLKISKL